MRAPLALLACAMLLGACDRGAEEKAAAGRPVGVQQVASGAVDASTALTGEIQAQTEVTLAFRIAGRLAERGVAVGDKVEPGQIVAKLDPETETNALRAAEAALAAARGRLVETRNTFQRQERLLGQGFTTRPRYDQARAAFETAQADLDNAEAGVADARERLSFTELRADAAGIVTERGPEPGAVVQPGQPIVRLAREGGLDAVFDVPARVIDAAPTDPLVSVALADSPSVTATGRVRELASQADPTTRTFRVRVGLVDPPAAMRLGSTVTGRMSLDTAEVIVIPASALTMSGRDPAVWIVDPRSKAVSLRAVEVLRYESGAVMLAHGLDPGETIVTRGVQALHPGQVVTPLADAASAGAGPT